MTMPYQVRCRRIGVWASLVLALCPVAQAAEPANEPRVERSVEMVPLRDGVRLKTIRYQAAGGPDRRPALLLRTPYNQDQKGLQDQARRLAAAGYAALTQDCRGRFGSEGQFVFYWGEGPDGFDTVEWLRRQPWCDGRVGMWGPSYMGSVQWLTAAEGTPLTVIAPTASASNFYYNLYLGGAYLLPHAKTGFCIDLFGPPTNLGSSPEWPRWYMHLPLTDWDKMTRRSVPWQVSMIRHYRPDGFWKRANAYPAFATMNVPGQHIVGYYDFMCRDSVRSYQALRERATTAYARDHQQLILGPWDHATGRRKAGDVDFGPAAEMDVLGENLKWFDYFLKKNGTSEQPFPPVRYFSMGENRWYTATAWPPPEAVATSFYLRSGGRANTRQGDGRLEAGAPATDEPADTFRADPADPVPAWPARGKQYQENWGPVDQQGVQDRADVLLYATPPLPRALRFAGQPQAELWVSADTPDADWVVKLLDVHPDGSAWPLASGVRRGSARDSELDRQPLVPGKKYRLQIDLGHAAARLDKGHRLAVQVAGSNFPMYDRNTNTGEGPSGSRILVATEKVWHTAATPSRLVLPVMSPTSPAGRAPDLRPGINPGHGD
jgi:predicted acyl esterase